MSAGHCRAPATRRSLAPPPHVRTPRASCLTFWHVPALPATPRPTRYHIVAAMHADADTASGETELASEPKSVLTIAHLREVLLEAFDIHVHGDKRHSLASPYGLEVDGKLYGDGKVRESMAYIIEQSAAKFREQEGFLDDDTLLPHGYLLGRLPLRFVCVNARAGRLSAKTHMPQRAPKHTSQRTPQMRVEQ